MTESMGMIDMKHKKALIFDLDGVITDTARCHYYAWNMLADQWGLRFDEEMNEKLKGVSRTDSLSIILKENHMEDRFSEEEKGILIKKKNDRYVKLVSQITKQDILPGILDCLEKSREKGLKLAIASASKNAFLVLEKLGIRNLFDYVADAEHIKYPKPHPEVFLNCANYLGIEPVQCIGFEDSAAGLEAIAAAGMVSVGIGKGIAEGMADWVLDSTEDVVRVLGLL